MDWSTVQMDLLSDDALQKIAAGGDKFDLNSLDDNDLQIIAAGPDKGFGPKADGSSRKFSEVDWLGAIANEFTKPAPKGSMVADNPLLLGAVPPFGRGVSVLGPGVAGPGVASPLARAGQALKGVALRAKDAAPEIVKDAAAGYAASKVDKALGGSGGVGSVLGGAIGRRVLMKGLGK